MKTLITIIEMIILRNATCTCKDNIKSRLFPRKAKEKKGSGHTYTLHMRHKQK